MSKEGYMKGLRSKNSSSITCITIVPMLVLSIIYMICAPHLCEAQHAANDLINRTAEAPSMALAVPYSLADLTGKWNVNTIASGPGAPYWFRAWITVLVMSYESHNYCCETSPVIYESIIMTKFSGLASTLMYSTQLHPQDASSPRYYVTHHVFL